MTALWHNYRIFEMTSNFNVKYAMEEVIEKMETLILMALDTRR